MSKRKSSFCGMCIVILFVALSGCESSDTGQKGSMYNPNTNSNMTSGGTGMGSGSMNSRTRGDGTDSSR